MKRWTGLGLLLLSQASWATEIEVTAKSGQKAVYEATVVDLAGKTCTAFQM